MDCFEYSVEEGVVEEFVNDQLNLGGVVDKDKEDELQNIVDLINKPRREVVEKVVKKVRKNAPKRKAVDLDDKRTFYELGEYDVHPDNEDLRDQFVEMSKLHTDIGKSAPHDSSGSRKHFASLHTAMGKAVSIFIC